jgi:hypothetical protein
VSIANKSRRKLEMTQRSICFPTFPARWQTDRYSRPVEMSRELVVVRSIPATDVATVRKFSNRWLAMIEGQLCEYKKLRKKTNQQIATTPDELDRGMSRSAIARELGIPSCGSRGTHATGTLQAAAFMRHRRPVSKASLLRGRVG